MYSCLTLVVMNLLTIDGYSLSISTNAFDIDPLPSDLVIELRDFFSDDVDLRN